MKMSNCMSTSFFSLNANGVLMTFDRPVVMGILNATPDSFYAGSRVQTEREIARRAAEIVEEGGMMVDVGAFSTRPGAAEVKLEEEMERLRFALGIVRREVPNVLLSVDTFRPEIATMAVEEFGASVINDVSEGGVTGIANVRLDGEATEVPEIFRTVARLQVAYVLMSVCPTLAETLQVLSKKVQLLRSLGQKDIIIDPGFGFGKTLGQNYALMSQMESLHSLELPLLVGVSRKSMIYKLLETTPDTSLNATTVLHSVALMKGAHVLRVHDVRAAVEAVLIHDALSSRSGTLSLQERLNK